jgi:transcription antitermination protein NusB
MTKRPMEETICAFYDTLRAEGAPEAAEESTPESNEDPAQDDRDEFASRHERDEFMEELAKGASAMAPDIDQRISQKSAHWKLERMPIVDRNILRLAIYEMSRKDTPAVVVIDEALELARQFSGEESVAFINGVLDAVHKENRN